VISNGLAGGIGRTVFFALIAHKAYESLTVSSVLIEKLKSTRATFWAITAYSLSLPVGVILTLLFKANLTQNVALLATSLAVGTLLGCLIFDFLLPSLAQIGKKRMDLAWIAVGLVVTQLMMMVSR
jgi:zinc transporter ZupT